VILWKLVAVVVATAHSRDVFSISIQDELYTPFNKHEGCNMKSLTCTKLWNAHKSISRTKFENIHILISCIEIENTSLECAVATTTVQIPSYFYKGKSSKLWYIWKYWLCLVKASDYYFDIFKLFYCLSVVHWRLLITTLVYSSLSIVCLSSIEGFWLPLWYIQAFLLSVCRRMKASDYHFGIFKPFYCLSTHQRTTNRQKKG
jgi:hypothetical protein